ncbi:hypothetical protein HJC23_005450 [Cyclotella cryptica]|uniref:Uncharacterized protein n=1 Tax=Cyclotella cryptica TaxID=29204 RepID=A0ABD3P3U0_9STRA
MNFRLPSAVFFALLACAAPTEQSTGNASAEDSDSFRLLVKESDVHFGLLRNYLGHSLVAAMEDDEDKNNDDDYANDKGGTEEKKDNGKKCSFLTNFRASQVRTLGCSVRIMTTTTRRSEVPELLQCNLFSDSFPFIGLFCVQQSTKPKEEDDDDNAKKKDKREKATPKPTNKPRKTSKPTKKPNSTKRRTNKPTKKTNATLPRCQVRGTNYLRCDPNKVKSRDYKTCRQIDNELCNQQRRKMKRSDISYCECIGLEPSAAGEVVMADVIGHLRGFMGI